MGKSVERLLATDLRWGVRERYGFKLSGSWYLKRL